jgi:transposase
LNERGAKIVISQDTPISALRKFGLEIYKWRHLIENLFTKLKEFQRITLRGDNTDRSFSAMIYMAAAVIHSR